LTASRLRNVCCHEVDGAFRRGACLRADEGDAKRRLKDRAAAAIAILGTLAKRVQIEADDFRRD